MSKALEQLEHLSYAIELSQSDKDGREPDKETAIVRAKGWYERSLNRVRAAVEALGLSHDQVNELINDESSFLEFASDFRHQLKFLLETD